VNSLSEILRGVAYAVEPLDFICIQHDLFPPVRDGMRNGLGKQANPFEELDDSH
jgi:hypothetical protein